MADHKEASFNVFSPPFEIWLKISKLVLFLESLANVDLKSTDVSATRLFNGGIQQELKVIHSIFADPGIKEWLDGIKSLKEQNVLKV